jgi:general secretion pathway protein A
MEYFKILNLIREPFSNSPEPDFFFHSPKHVRCLQKLELAIRLRRGLNVVMGHVGTGKTTLCRYLISQFAEPKEEAEPVEAHLMMDPSFTSPQEFLTAVAMSFGIVGKRKRRTAHVETHPLTDPFLNAPLDLLASGAVPAGKAGKRSKSVAPDNDLTLWQLKENIKDHLFKKGVNEQKTVLLIIDEGQKLPDFCLEILREFLNYETNENKLLQIVIFAQPEFQQILQRLENFADRVNLLYRLEPLNFSETRDMIQFRLDQASEPGYAPALFTLSGFLAIYLATHGYPRKVITLCHQVVLAMIIQNRTQAGWFPVRTCAARLASADATWRSRSLRWAPAMLITLAALLIFLAIRPLTNGSIKSPSVFEKNTLQTSPLPQEAAQPTPQEASRKMSAAPEASPQSPSPSIQEARQKKQVTEYAASGPVLQDAARQEKPKLLGKLTIKNGRTIWWMLNDFYGAYEEGIFRSVAQANPHIRNLSRVSAGETIHLPALSGGKSPLLPGKYFVQILTSRNLENIYEYYRTYKEEVSSLKFLPYWNPRQGVLFSIILKDGAPDEASARQIITRLPAALATEAGVLKNFEPDTVFFTR